MHTAAVRLGFCLLALGGIYFSIGSAVATSKFADYNRTMVGKPCVASDGFHSKYGVECAESAAAVGTAAPKCLRYQLYCIPRAQKP